MTDSLRAVIERLQASRKTAHFLLEQAAAYGGEIHLPPERRHSLTQMRRDIAQCKAELRARGVVVDDQPEDGGSIVSGQDDTGPAELAQRARQHRRHLVAQLHTLRLDGLDIDGVPLQLPLEHVYTPLRLVAELPAGADTFSPDERRLLRQLETTHPDDPKQGELHDERAILGHRRWNRSRPERLTVPELLHDRERRGVVLLGDPGSGKSTLLLFLALVFAQGPEAVTQQFQLPAGEAGRLPILAPLSAYDDMLAQTSDLTLPEFLARFYAERRLAPGLGPVFSAALAAGTALVLLDGLDEVREASRRRVVAEQVDHFVRVALAAGNRVIVTSRIVGYHTARLASELRHLTVLDFGQQEQETFARQWTRALAIHEHGSLTPQAEQQARQEEGLLRAEIRTSPGASQLAANPLMLTMLALLRRRHGALPQRRISLYHRYLTTLLDQWQHARSQSARRHTSIPTRDPEETVQALIALARWFQEHRPSGAASTDQVLDQLTRFFLEDDPHQQRTVPRGRARALLDDLRQEAGLLIERGQGSISFRHLTFQEFFAGRALAQLPAEERWALLAPRLHETRWREPFLLGVAWLGAVEGRTDEAADLVRRVLAAGSPYEEALHRDLFLAAAAAGDDSGLPPTLLQQLADMLWPLCDSPVPAVARGALDRLHRLALLRSGGRARLPAVQERVIDQLLHPSGGGWGSEQLNALARFPLAVDFAARQQVLDHLDHQAPIPRILALHTLAPLVTGYPEVRTAILRSCTSSHEEVRAAAIGALAVGVAEDTELHQQVRAALDDPNGRVQEVAIKVLAPLLPVERELADAVAELLHDEGEIVCRAAYDALVPLLPSRPELLVPIVDALSALLYTDNHQESFAGWIDVTAPDRAHLRPPLLSLLEDRYADRRQVAVELLSPLADVDPAIRTALLARLDDSHPDVVEATVYALAEEAARHPEVAQAFHRAIDGGQLSPEALEAAIDALSSEVAQDDVWRARLLAVPIERGEPEDEAVLLGLVGLIERCSDVRARLLDLLDRGHSVLQFRVLYALRSLLATDPALRLRVARLMHASDAQMRRSVLETLAPYVERDRACASVLQDTLRHRDGQAREGLLGLLAPPGQPLRAPAALIAAQFTNTACAEAGIGRALVVKALGLLADDPAVQPVILASLQDEDARVRQAAVQVLVAPGHADLSIRMALIERLMDAVPSVAGAAVGALEPLAVGDTVTREALIQVATRPGPRAVRQTALKALRPLATDESVRAALLDLLAREGNDEQVAALQALVPLAPTDVAVRQALLHCAAEAPWMGWHGLGALTPLLPQDAELRAVVLQHLAHPTEIKGASDDLLGLVQEDAEARAAVAAWLASPHKSIRLRAIHLLQPLVATHPELRESLLVLVDDLEPAVQVAALNALHPLASADTAVDQTLVAALDEPLVRIWQIAVSTLAPLDHAHVRQRLLADLRTYSGRLRAYLVQVLAPQASHHPEVLAALLECLEDPSTWVRQTALGALVPLAADDLVLRERLLLTLTDSSAWVRKAAVQTLTPLAQIDPAVRSVLAACLSDPEAIVRSTAVTCLAPLAERNASLRTQLLALQHDSSRDVRIQIVTAAGKQLWSESLPLLRAYLDDSSTEVRTAALGELVQFISRAPDLASLLLPLAEGTLPGETISDRRPHLAPAHLADLIQAFAALVRQDETWLAAVRVQLGAADWRLRGGAAQILAVAGVEAMRAALPELLQALDDWRGPESWPARLAAAAALLNHNHYSDNALAVLDEALVFGEGALLPPRSAATVRRRAVTILSQLAALDRRPAVAARIADLLAMEQNNQVLNGLYHALTSLVEAPEPDQEALG